MYRAYRLDNRGLSLWRLLGWRGIAVMAVALALVVALAIAATGLFLVLLPIFLVAGLVGRFLSGRAQRRQPGRRAPDVLEGHYEVLEVEQPAPGRGWGRPGR
jgi:hypothetical protein